MRTWMEVIEEFTIGIYSGQSLMVRDYMEKAQLGFDLITVGFFLWD